MKNKYKKRGFVIGKWHADNEFGHLRIKKAISPAILDTNARNEHIGVVEISILEIKERAHCMY